MGELAALERLKIAVQENWRCNLTGVLVKALKEGVPAEDAAPPCAFFGGKEWADEAIKRRLMQYSHSQDGDIMVPFALGGQGMWSQLRTLSWTEVELTARVATSSMSDCTEAFKERIAQLEAELRGMRQQPQAQAQRQRIAYK